MDARLLFFEEEYWLGDSPVVEHLPGMYDVLDSVPSNTHACMHTCVHTHRHMHSYMYMYYTLMHTH